jgi:hypothetical protein
MIEVVHGLTEKYKDSVVPALYADDTWAGPGKIGMLVQAKEPLHMAVQITFHAITRVQGLELQKLYLMCVFKKPMLINELEADFELAVQVYDAAGNVTGRSAVRYLKGVVGAWAKVGFGTRLQGRVLLKLDYSR